MNRFGFVFTVSPVSVAILHGLWLRSWCSKDSFVRASLVLRPSESIGLCFGSVVSLYSWWRWFSEHAVLVLFAWLVSSVWHLGASLVVLQRYVFALPGFMHLRKLLSHFH